MATEVFIYDPKHIGMERAVSLACEGADYVAHAADTLGELFQLLDDTAFTQAMILMPEFLPTLFADIEIAAVAQDNQEREGRTPLIKDWCYCVFTEHGPGLQLRHSKQYELSYMVAQYNIGELLRDPNLQSHFRTKVEGLDAEIPEEELE